MNDCISRHAAINMFEPWLEVEGYTERERNVIGAVVYGLKHLPSAQPEPTADVVEVVRCKDCKYVEVDNADFPNQYFCNHHGCDWNDENHFCGYGELKNKP